MTYEEIENHFPDAYAIIELHTEAAIRDASSPDNKFAINQKLGNWVVLMTITSQDESKLFVYICSEENFNKARG